MHGHGYATNMAGFGVKLVFFVFVAGRRTVDVAQDLLSIRLQRGRHPHTAVRGSAPQIAGRPGLGF